MVLQRGKAVRFGWTVNPEPIVLFEQLEARVHIQRAVRRSYIDRVVILPEQSGPLFVSEFERGCTHSLRVQVPQQTIRSFAFTIGLHYSYAHSYPFKLGP